jgi:hypothetical protein
VKNPFETGDPTTGSGDRGDASFRASGRATTALRPSEDPMPALTAAETSTALVDLVIHEFDQWSDQAEPSFAPTTICWYGQDDAVE